LSPPEKLAIREAESDPELFGILRPRVAGLGTKCISRDAALLWLMLQHSDTLPEYALRALGDRCDDFIAKMVFDGILEIEADGRMHSGPGALSVLRRGDESDHVESSLATLSRRAVAYAAALEIADPVVLSARLYAFNRVPVTPRWRRLLPDEPSVGRYVNLREVAPLPWRRLKRALPTGWIVWQRPSNGRNENPSAIYKLYVSPACSALRQTIAIAASVVFRSAALQWKCGNDATGLLRPDKFVAYFASFSQLQETAAEILGHLCGCPAHGTPFTADLGGGGLVSWGVDPGAGAGDFRSLEGESWRSLICNRLAAALALAKSSAATGVSPESFALERLGLEGIDTSTWAPTAGLAWM
jgi:hypothetical protein